MTPPLLKLIFVKGPKDGESVEFKPKSTIRIGRIVRGNEIAIKDAGISTKHLRIVSDSDKWLIEDLGSSNGTIVNSESLDPDTPVNLRHGDIIKLGELTSIVVNFVNNDEVEAPEEDKLPLRPRRNNRRVAVADPVPDPVESKPTRRGRPKKQEDKTSKEDEPPKRTRAAARTKTLEDIAMREKELEVNPRASRSRRAAVTNVVKEEEEVAEDKKGKSRVRRGKNTETVQNSVKMEIEDIPEEIETNRATSSKEIANAGIKLVNVKSEDTVLEEEQVEKRATRATRSKKNVIAGDSVVNIAPRSRATRKKTETRIDVAVEEESLNIPVQEDQLETVEQVEIALVEDDMNCSVREEDKENETEKEDASKRVEQVEIEVVEDELNRSVREEDKENEGEIEQVEIEVEEEDLNCNVREDGETENVQSIIDEERDGKSKEEEEEARIDEEVDLEKMTLGGWFDYMEVNLRKTITEETEKMLEPLRSRALRVHKYIEEQKQAKGIKK